MLKILCPTADIDFSREGGRIVIDRVSRCLRSRRGAAWVVSSVLLYLWLGGATGDWAGTLFVSPLLGAVGVFSLGRIWEGRTWPPVPTFARRPAIAASAKMLREDANACLFTDRGGFLFERRYFVTATGLRPVRLSSERFAQIEALRHAEAVQVVDIGHRVWWLFGDTWCWENCGYTSHDVRALLMERDRRHQSKLNRAHAVLAAEQLPPQNRRGPITRQMRQVVWERDGGECVECGATFDLQYDHIIPVAMGGATTIENLQLLCGGCNLAKGATLG